MGTKKKDKLERLKALFLEHRILNKEQICEAIESTSGATVFRYLTALNYLTSYNHNGKFHTIPEIPQFNHNGLWHHNGASFSVCGTLIDTLEHTIGMAESGKTNQELQACFKVCVQGPLQTLLKSKRIEYTMIDNNFLYLSSDPDTRAKQIEKRTEFEERKKMPTWLVNEILAETIRAFPAEIDSYSIYKSLMKKGSLVTQKQVKQVFEEHGLEKKTLH